MQRVKDLPCCTFLGFLLYFFFNENLGCGGPMARICLLESTTLEQLTDMPLPCVGRCG